LDHGPACVAGSVAARTLLAAIYRNVCRKARERFFETQRQRDLDIAALLRQSAWRFRLGARSWSPATSTEEIGKDIAEPEFLAMTGAAGAAAERSASARLRTLIAAPRLAIGVDLAPVVLLALHRIADDVVGGGHFLETLFRRGGIARIEIGMQLLGQLAIDAANLLVRRVARHAQYLVGVLGHLVVSPSSPALGVILT